MEEIKIYNKNGCMQIPALIVSIGFVIFTLCFVSTAPILLLCTIFFLVIAIMTILGMAYADMPIIIIKADGVDSRRPYSKTYTNLKYKDIKNFKFELHRQTAVGAKVNEQLKVIAYLKKGGKETFLVNNYEDPEKLARILNYLQITANTPSA